MLVPQTKYFTLHLRKVTQKTNVQILLELIFLQNNALHP